MPVSLKQTHDTDLDPLPSGLAVFVCDERGELLAGNRAGQVLLGNESEEGGSVGVSETMGESVNSFLSGLLEGDEPTKQQWLTLRSPGNAERRARAIGLRIPDHDGKIIGAVAVLAVGQRAGSTSSASEKSESRADPVTGTADLSEPYPREHTVYLDHDEIEVVSHQLRTPINAVVGYAALLHERVLGDLSEQQERAVRRIEAAAQQLLSAVNHALLVAHLEVGDFEAGDFTHRRGSLRPVVNEGGGP